MKSGDYDFYIVKLLVHNNPIEINVMLPPDLTEEEKQRQLEWQVRKFLMNQTEIQSVERVDNK